jgi:hypothetical protein
MCAVFQCMLNNLHVQIRNVISRLGCDMLFVITKQIVDFLHKIHLKSSNGPCKHAKAVLYRVCLNACMLTKAFM